MQTVEEINAITYRMLMDFCKRAGEMKIPTGMSAELYMSMNYIRSHTNQLITLSDVASNINRSISYVEKMFRKELNIKPGAYINRCKLEEAKSLLTFSERTIADIAAYLCFSSQAHFQAAFKKQYGITPGNYRLQTQKIL